MNTYNKIIGEIREKLSQGSLKISKISEDSFMSGDNFYKRINRHVLKMAPNLTPIKMKPNFSCTTPLNLKLSRSEIFQCMLKNGIFTQDPDPKFTVWVVVNPESTTGIEVLNEISKTDPKLGIRFGLILSTPPNSDRISLTSLIVEHALKNQLNFNSLTAIIVQQISNAQNIYGFNVNLNAQNISGAENSSNAQRIPADKESIMNVLAIHELYKSIFHIYDNENYIIYLNRRFGPISKFYKFTSVDFEIIARMHENNFRPLNNVGFVKMFKDRYKAFSDLDSHSISEVDFMDFIKSVIGDRVNKDAISLSDDYDKYPLFVLNSQPRDDRIFIKMDAVINPVSGEGQKLLAYLQLLLKAVNIKLRVFLTINEYFNERVSNRYYRYVMEPVVRFKGDMLDETMNTAVFDDIPHDSLFTFHSETIQSWFVKSKFSNCDMDNIYLQQNEIGCVGIYELEYLIVEGHAYNSRKGQPASGLQLVMGCSSQPHMFDTIVIHNLGYFQLKGYAGAFYLKLKGESEDSYMFDRILSLTNGAENIITVDSFLGQLIKVNVIPKSVLDEKVKDKKNWWDSIADVFGGKISNDGKLLENQINVFTVATGLLYERFIRIMILSVLEHTKTPVKFWFLKNYLSFQFTESIDLLSKRFNFSYEFVQYQWPHWLLKQSEKQRTIWGYKILFLDVLFPLDVKKIIFVDADQIVRADLKELYDMDLEDAPYAYTPFCDDRPEMDKFRFWKSGYWLDHLRGKPYHISALYVVDLIKFREMMAGDRLRGQYQMLSRDPNSLANLDQDLPNNLQEIVPIKSLPQEWLWCETWCSDKSKEKAKTIDMCNNPLTHEAKLDRAKRIAPEFTKYDKIINEVLNGEENCLVEVDPSKKDEL